jgi:hypothetical protein
MVIVTVVPTCIGKCRLVRVIDVLIFSHVLLVHVSDDRQPMRRVLIGLAGRLGRLSINVVDAMRGTPESQ